MLRPQGEQNRSSQVSFFSYAYIFFAARMIKVFLHESKQIAVTGYAPAGLRGLQPRQMKRDGRDIAVAFASRTTMSKRNKAIFPRRFRPFFHRPARPSADKVWRMQTEIA